MGILWDSLQIAPQEAPKNGMAFGWGLYFADLFEMSFSYFRQEKNDPVFLLLAEVALGTENKICSSQFMEKAPQGFHCTLAYNEKTRHGR